MYKNKTVSFNENDKQEVTGLILEVETKDDSWTELLTPLDIKNSAKKYHIAETNHKGIAKAIINNFNRTRKPQERERSLVGILVKRSGTYYTKS